MSNIIAIIRHCNVAEVLKEELWGVDLLLEPCWLWTWQITWLVLTFLPSVLLTLWKSIFYSRYAFGLEHVGFCSSSHNTAQKNLRAPALSSNQCEPWNESLKCAIFCRVGSKRRGKTFDTAHNAFVFFGGKRKAAHNPGNIPRMWPWTFYTLFSSTIQLKRQVKFLLWTDLVASWHQQFVTAPCVCCCRPAPCSPAGLAVQPWNNKQRRMDTARC